MNISDLKACCR